MFINDIPISSYGAIMLGTPEVSPATITPENIVFRNGTNFINNRSTIGLKSIKCNIAFLGNDYHDIQLKRSNFRAALLGKINIAFEKDRFQYFCTYNSDNELEHEHENAAVSIFNFTGVQHEALETAESKTVFCRSTVPETDCVIKCLCNGSYIKLNIAGVIFPYTADNYECVIDGINKKIMYGGNDVIAEFIKFPVLSPGINTLSIDTNKFYSITVEYYPTYL